MLFSHWTATTWLAWPRFMISSVLLFLLPGGFTVRSLQLLTLPLETLALSLALGLILACILHVLQTWLGIVWPLRLWIVIGMSYAAWRGRAVFTGCHPAASGPAHALLLLALPAVWLPLLCLPFFYSNLALLSEGGLSYANNPDIALHASLATELARNIPPQIPFIAGEALNYHIGMDLVAAVLHRHGGVAIMDLTVRFCPTFFLAFAVLAVFVLSRRFTGSARASVAAAVLVILGEDLAFIFGLLDGNSGIWCVDYFGAPTIFSLYFFNPMVLALGLLFISLLGFQRVLAGGGRGWMVVTALCTTALIYVKIFVFVQLVFAAGLVMLVAMFTPRRSRMLTLLVIIALMSAPLVLILARQHTHAATIIWTWASGWTSYIMPAFRTHGGWLLACPPLAVAAYIVLTFSLRCVGFGALLRSLRRPFRRLFALLLTVFVVLGPVLSLTGRIAPVGRALAYNNAIWFLVASKYVVWLFAVAVLARVGRCHSWCVRALLVVLAAVLSLPGTVQFIVQKPLTLPTQKLTHETLAVLIFLDHTVAPGAVVFSMLDGPLLTATTLHVPLGSAYAASFISAEKVAARTRDIGDFQGAWRAGIVRTDILNRYHAAWILMPRAIIGTDLTTMVPVFSNQEYFVFRVMH